MRSLSVEKAIVLAVTVICLGTNNLFAGRNDEVESLFNAGMSSRSQEEILFYAKKVDAIATATADVLTGLRAQMLFGKYYLLNSRINSADSVLMHCELAFCKHQALKQTVDYSKMLLLRSMVYYNMGEPEASVRYRLKALRVARDIKSEEQQMAVLRAMASLEISNGHPEEALFYFLEYLPLKNAVKSTQPDNGDDDLLLANIYISTKQYDNAKTHITKAIALQARNGHEQNLSFSYNVLGVIYRSVENYDSAFRCFEKAKEIALRNNQPLAAFNADNNIAINFLNLGQYQRSIQLIEKMLDESEGLPLLARLSPMQYKGVNYYKLGDRKKALAAAWQSYNAAVDLEAKRSTIEAAELLAKIYSDLKRYDSSTFFLQTKIALGDSLINFRTQDKFTKVHAQLQTIEKQKEIKLLEQEKALQQSRNKFLIVIFVFVAVTVGLAGCAIFFRYQNNKKKQKLLQFQLEAELDRSQSELKQQAVRMIHINNGLSEVFNALKKEKAEGHGKSELQSMINAIQINQSLDKEWQNFDRYFGNVHKDFINHLTTTFPTLSIMEKRLAALVKMNLTNKEIAAILNIEPKSVTVAKYRLKKRLGLANGADIADYLQALSKTVDHSKNVAA